MRCEPWMNRDERSEDQKRIDRLNQLKHEEAVLHQRLEEIQAEIAMFPARKPVHR